MTVQNRISKGIKELLMKYSFYGVFLMHFKQVPKESIPTAGVTFDGATPILLYNPKFIEGLNSAELSGLLVHEVLHLVLQHHYLSKLFNNKDRFNVAADLEINSIIEKKKLKLPEGALLPEQFNLDPLKGTKYYYENLPEDVKGKFHCWADITKEEQELVKGIINKILLQSSTQSKTPSELISIVDSLKSFRPPAVNYRKILRNFVGNSISEWKKKTKKRLNRRFIEAKGLKKEYKLKVILYLDGSGSVLIEKEYPLFYNELVHLSKIVTLYVAHFDTKVGEPYLFKDIGELPKSNGGTRFTPIKEHLNNSDFDCAFIATDGEAENPGRFSKPVMWLLTRNTPLNYQGKKLYLNTK